MTLIMVLESSSEIVLMLADGEVCAAYLPLLIALCIVLSLALFVLAILIEASSEELGGGLSSSLLALFEEEATD